MNYFITAIGTDSGKTVISAIVAEALGADYWKPVQSGTPTDTETIKGLISSPDIQFHPERHRLKTPASPHAAAKIDRVNIKLTDFELPETPRPLVVEGAGGVMVPLNDHDLVIDLADVLNLEIILVSNLYLGSINHTLLTITFLKERGYKIKGIIFNGEPNPESEDIILKHAKLPCLLRVKQHEQIDKETIKAYAAELKEAWKTDLQTRDNEVIWHPFTPLIGGPELLSIKSAEGAYLYTDDGKKILDAISCWWVNLHGHSHPHIAKAVAHQASTLEHVIFAGFTHEPAVKLAENVLTILPENQSKIFYSDNGSTAVEVGLKMAFQFWYNQGIKKPKVIAFEGSYHGDTFGSMSVGDRSAFSAPFDQYLFQVEFLPFPTNENKDQVLEQFNSLVSRGDVGAFIFEPLVQGVSGMRMYSSWLLDEMVGLAHKHDVLCIADEVFTGFGRTGQLFASNFLENKPDIMALSKGLTGGTMALGATSCSDEIVEVYRSNDPMKTFFHGHSYTANPIACAAGNASFELLIQQECRDNRDRIALRNLDFLFEIKQHPALRDARALGTILAMELDSDDITSYLNDTRKKIYPFFLSKGILCRPLGNVIYILPPYIMTDEQLDTVYDAVRAFLDKQ
ncbi:MAG: adenosylmethionine--8-amino-7-oxononanoate transaminase [Bacteroidota bacterium]